MLTKVEVRTDRGALLTLPMQDISDGYVVKGIDGLDPVKATIVSSSFAELDGEQYQSARREKRNLIFSLGYQPNYGNGTVRELRNNLYKFFMPKANVNLRFFMDDFGAPFVEIEGKVESFAAPLFTADPEANLSLLCFKPDFYYPEAITVPGASNSGLSNEGTTTNQEGYISIDYEGTVETGFVFRFMIDRDISDFTFNQTLPDGTVNTLSFVAPLLDGDILEISTVSGAKGATLIRGGASSSILYGISPYSAWLNLFPGENKFRVLTHLTGGTPYTIEYTNKYGGL